MSRTRREIAAQYAQPPDAVRPQVPEVDIDRLSAALRERVRGEVRFEADSRALYATDSSNYRQVPIGVVVPRTVEDIAATVLVCREFGVPILHRGGGTSLAGQCCNTAVVIDSSKYCHRVVGIDPARRTATVEPGTVLDTLQAHARPHGLVFGPDPSTHAQCTLGGMIGNNSAGVHSVYAGRTADNVEELEVMTYDGLRLTVGRTSDTELNQIIAQGGRRADIYARLRDLRDRYADLIRQRYPDIPRRVSGYNLNQLLPENHFNVARALVGTEGTCVSILRATVRLVKFYPHRVIVAVGFDDICHAADFVPRMLEHRPIGVEGIDERLVENMRKKNLHSEDIAVLPDGKAWLLVEFGADEADAAVDQARGLQAALAGNVHVQETKVLTEPDQQARMWQVRESGLGATAFVPGDRRDTWPGWEDSAVHPNDLGNYLRELLALYRRYDYRGALYGHFGDGLVHSRIDFGLHTDEDVARFRRFLFDAAELCVRYRGSFTGEHGDGLARSQLLPIMFGPELIEAFRAFKAIWDPDGKMNPGRIVDPFPVDTHLRLGPRFRPPHYKTVFRYPEDDRSFTRAALRCVGVGKCRRQEGGTMCPSYRATREEKHTTRGRARLLQEMLQGDPIRDGWRSGAVRDALDLCLSCKGCKRDCPVNVDMATYKAEFLYHHYEGRLRPRAAYSLGQIHRWARLVAPWPQPVNWAMTAPGLGRLLRAAAGIHPDRAVPRFAPRTFRRDFAPRSATDRSKAPVVLWTDTFNNHFEPGVLRAAQAVIEAAGHPVEIPARDLCCGRPFYDFGMLGPARRLLRRCLDGLKGPLEAGAWVVGVEPSCLATFRDELPNLFPDDPLARRLSERALLFGEFLANVADGTALPHVGRRAVVHGHCYQKAIFGMEADRKVLDRAAMDYEVLDSGCCGMAGAFGYETHKYPVSLAIAELVLLPAVRRLEPDVLVIADGYSCREQINQCIRGPGGRRATTLPEVLHAGMAGEAAAVSEGRR